MRYCFPHTFKALRRQFIKHNILFYLKRCMQKLHNFRRFRNTVSLCKSRQNFFHVRRQTNIYSFLCCGHNNKCNKSVTLVKTSFLQQRTSERVLFSTPSFSKMIQYSYHADKKKLPQLRCRNETRNNQVSLRHTNTTRPM